MATQTRNPTSDIQEGGTITNGSAGSRYLLVDDHPDAGVTDFYRLDTTNAFVRHGFSAFTVPAGATINAVRVHYYDRKTASAVAGLQARITVAGSLYNAADHNPSETATLRTDEWLVNPDTGLAWTVDDVNGSGANPLQSFSTRATDGEPDVEVWSVQIEVDYTVPSDTLSFTQQPTTAVEGVVISPDVKVTSTDGTFTGNVTVALEDNPAGGGLTGTLTVAAVGGVATFDDLEIDTPGTYTLLATATDHTEIESDSFDITLEAATHLVFFVGPSDAQVDAIIAPPIKVRARNNENVLDTNYTANVVIAIQTNPGTGVLGGTLTQAAVAGVATFDDLTLDEAGVGYVLRATSGALTLADSATFDITASPPPATPSRAFSIRLGSPLTMRL